MKYTLQVKDGMTQYTREEERFHVCSHLVGILVGIATLIYTLSSHQSEVSLLGGTVFGISLVLLYSVSCLYHGTDSSHAKLKRIFQVMDHCTIFILIAGTGTPLVLCVLGQYSPQIATTYNLFLWGCALLGSILLVISMKRFKAVSIGLYLIMGFSALRYTGLFLEGLGQLGFMLFVAGGISYCIGLVFYSIKVKWTHSIFHVLCMMGTLFHCACIWLYAI